MPVFNRRSSRGPAPRVSIPRRRVPSSLKARRATDGRLHGRQVLAEIDWWTVTAGQLPTPVSQDGSNDDSWLLSSGDEEEESEPPSAGWSVDVDDLSLDICDAFVTPSSPAASATSSLWSTPSSIYSSRARCTSTSSNYSTSSSRSPSPSPLPSRLQRTPRLSLSRLQAVECTPSPPARVSPPTLHRSASFAGFNSPRNGIIRLSPSASPRPTVMQKSTLAPRRVVSESSPRPSGRAAGRRRL